MCAILGVSFVPGSEINRHKLASALLSAGESRGRDASGFAYVSPNGDGVYKKDLPGGKLHVGRIPSDASAMILHTRASTHGSPTDMENNHPVISPSGAIRLVHNGVVYNHDEIRDLLGKVGKSLPEVDSSVIPAIIEEYGLEATSELAGYASAAWFDDETADTIHLARFKTSTVFFAGLYDGSLAFASTADILAKALTKVGIPWYGSYPSPFDQMAEGEYYQIMNGEIVSESTVDWKRDYQYAGRDWRSVTSGATTRSATSSTTVGFGRGSEDAKGLVVLDSEEDKKAGDDAIARLEAQAEKGEPLNHADVVAAVFGMASDDEDQEYLSPAELAHWRETGELFGSEEADDPDAEEVVEGTFYTLGHDGDYASYRNSNTLMTALRWHSGLNAEDALVGPDEGLARWANHFADVGHLSRDGAEQYSWVKSDEYYREYSVLFPAGLHEGISALRKLVGA